MGSSDDGAQARFDGDSDRRPRPTLASEELQAAIASAHLLGKRVAVHTYLAAVGDEAVRFGADSLEQTVELDDATMAAMAKRRTVYVPVV